jgi:hypothetical protein
MTLFIIIILLQELKISFENIIMRRIIKVSRECLKNVAILNKSIHNINLFFLFLTLGSKIILLKLKFALNLCQKKLYKIN